MLLKDTAHVCHPLKQTSKEWEIQVQNWCFHILKFRAFLSKYTTWEDGGMHSKCLHCNVNLTDLTNKLINQFKVQFLALQSRYPRVVCLVLFIVINLQKYEEKLSTNNDNDGCDDNNNNENNDNEHSAKNISKFNITKMWSCRSQFPSSIDMYQLQTTFHVIFSMSADNQWGAT